MHDVESLGRRSFYNSHRFKLGLFGANCSSGRAVTKVPERWSGSWFDGLRLAQMADEAGIDFLMPIARWKGYGGESDYQGATLETVTWASGLLAKTRRITIFGTVHAPLLHPVIAAKEFVTADHIGSGRFGVNVVCGWNEDEFEMFGVQKQDHETRYEYAEEWLAAIKRMWTEPGQFDFHGKFIVLKDVRVNPKPYGGGQPMIMNAGASSTGQRFAIRNCDALFSATRRNTLAASAKHIRDVRFRAQQQGRAIDVYTVGVVTCRQTARQAEEYHHHCMVENADWTAIDKILALRRISPQSVPSDEFEKMRNNTANGLSGLPLIGDPDQVARDLAAVHEAGFSGIAVSFVNYADEMPYFCDEVVPRLERLGLRDSRH